MGAILPISFICLIVLLLRAWVKGSWAYAVWSVLGTGFAAVLLSGLLYFGFGLLYLIPYEPTTAEELAAAYRVEFDVPPPSGIKVMHARQSTFMDSGTQWLLLEATPEEIEKHIARGFEHPANVPSDFKDSAGDRAPSWWQPQGAQLELYEHRDWTKNGGWCFSRAAMGVDRSKNLIWFVADKQD